ncbi:MAG: ribonuclease H family protein [Bacteroidales bacterium]|nr:ribonuclease H family protein [Bacteroidales bacterium]
MAVGKYYVVWEGRAPGIYSSWEECQEQVEGYPDARYRSFPDLVTATEAFRGDPREQMALFRAMSSQRAQAVNYSAIPEIRTDAIAVDGACSRNPGPTEYRGVEVLTGRELFRVGPIAAATNNIGEYLAIIHAAAMLRQRGDATTPIYSDSRTALAWIRAGHHRSRLVPSAENARARDLLARADRWLAANGPIVNPLLKWDTEHWGEIPADFGRK